jgi:gliding motility-associated protein GldM
MAHKKETPRQKMIGMMYLVLTALLALNVSKDILDAFVIVDESITTTTDNFSKKNKIIYQDFDQAYQQNKDKVGPWKNKADAVRKEADDLYNLINTLKIKIVKKTEGDTLAIVNQRVVPDNIKAKDNKDIPAEIMVGTTNNGDGKKLKEKIELFRDHLLAMIDKKDVPVMEALKKNLNTTPPKGKEGATQTWESYNFEHWPLIAVTTIMSKLQSDIRNAESEITRYLYKMIDQGAAKFTNLDAVVIPNTNYVLQGTDYRAEIFLAAYDSTQSPTILIDGRPIEVKKGRGIYTVRGSGTGLRKWGGVIQVKSTDAPTIERHFNAEYMVAEANAVISPTKMNVFYQEVDNPVEVSVSGIPANKLFPSISNGTMTKSGNGYIVRPGPGSKSVITVMAEIDKAKKSMGSMTFRVKALPDPVAKVGGKKGGYIAKNELIAQQFVLADLEGFDFEARFTVTEFTVSIKKGGFDQDVSSHSQRFTDAQKDLLKNLNRGDKVIFTDIKAKGPSGKVRELNGIILKIQ